MNKCPACGRNKLYKFELYDASNRLTDTVTLETDDKEKAMQWFIDPYGGAWGILGEYELSFWKVKIVS